MTGYTGANKIDFPGTGISQEYSEMKVATNSNTVILAGNNIGNPFAGKVKTEIKPNASACSNFYTTKIGDGNIYYVNLWASVQFNFIEFRNERDCTGVPCDETCPLLAP